MNARNQQSVQPRATPSRSAVPDSDVSGNVRLVLYLIFVTSWFLHFGARFPIWGAIRFDLVLVVGMALLCVRTEESHNGAQAGSSTRAWLIVLVAFAVLTIPFVEWPGSAVKRGLEDFVKAAVFFYFTVTIVRNERDLAYLLLAFVGGQAFRVMEPVYLHLTQGYWGSYTSMANWESMDRLSGAPLDIINPNGLAFVIVTAMVFCHYLSPRTKVGTVAYLVFLPIALYALALTASRTGMLAFGIVLVTIWWKSKHRLMLLAVIAVAVPLSLPFFSADLKDRYLSIVSSDTKNAASASERTDDLRTGFNVVLRRPLFGYGLGTSREANANFGNFDRPSHNLYIEVAEELGFLGLAIYLGFMFSVGRDLMRSPARPFPEGKDRGLVPRLRDAVQVWFVMNLLFSFASYGLMSYEWYFMAGLSAVINRFAVDASSGVLAKPEQAVHQRLGAVSRFSRPGVGRVVMARP